MTEIKDQINIHDVKKFQPSYFIPKVGQTFYPSITGQISSIEIMLRSPLAKYKLTLCDANDNELESIEFEYLETSVPYKVNFIKKPFLEKDETYKFFIECIDPRAFSIIVWATTENNYKGALLDNLKDKTYYEFKELSLYFITFMIPIQQ